MCMCILPTIPCLSSLPTIPSSAGSGAAHAAFDMAFELVHASGPRGAAWGGVAEAGRGGHGARARASREFIEERNQRGLVDRAAVVASLYADLELLSRADALVGTAASWTTRAALLAIVGERGSVPPLAMVDRPLRQVWFS